MRGETIKQPATIVRILFWVPLIIIILFWILIELYYDELLKWSVDNFSLFQIRIYGNIYMTLIILWIYSISTWSLIAEIRGLKEKIFPPKNMPTPWRFKYQYEINARKASIASIIVSIFIASAGVIFTYVWFFISPSSI